jgi:hypothetical protein
LVEVRAPADVLLRGSVGADLHLKRQHTYTAIDGLTAETHYFGYDSFETCKAAATVGQGFTGLADVPPISRCS